MSSFSFTQLLDEAKKEGVAGTVPDGHYTLVVHAANTGTTKANDPKIGVMWKVVGGPQDGTTFWTNINLIASSPKSLAIAFRDLAALGAPQEWLATNPSIEEVKARVLAAPQMEADVTRSGDFTNVRNLKAAATAPSAVPAAPPAATVPAGTAPSPAPVRSI